jgi:hypothetical protein
MAYSEEDKHVIKYLRLSKGYGSVRIMKECPDKNWTRRGLDHLLKKIDSLGSVSRLLGSGRPRSVRTDVNIELVSELVLSQDDKPQTHRTQREIVRETGISRSSVRRIIKNDLRLKCFKKTRAHELTVANKAARLARSRQLLERFPAHLVNFIVFTDEKIFTVASPSNLQNDRLYARVDTRKKDIPADRLLRTRPTFTKSLMVSVGISILGTTDMHFVEPGVKVNGEYYRDVLLTEKLLPDMRRMSDFFVFQQDGAPAHRARDTVRLLETETPDFIEPSMWPANSPDLNPVDYRIWGALQEKVYKSRIADLDCLKQRLLDEWNKFDQRIIDSSIMEWRKRLTACVNAHGGHFEFKL